MDIKRITNKDGKLIHEYNVTIDDLEEICKDLPDFKEDDIKDVLTKNKCVLKKVNDAYTLYIGDEEISFDECDFKGAVKQQKILPNESYKYINGNTRKGKKAISDLKGWEIEDIKIER